MANIMKLAAVAMLLVTAQSANAISLRFKFKTFSSGPSMYACNAGIRTPQGPQVCYIQDTGEACTPKACPAGDNTCHTRCVCSSTNGGAYLMNYGRATYLPWVDNDGSTGTSNGSLNLSHSATTVFQDMGTSWKQLLKDNSNGSNASGTSNTVDAISWNNRIQDLSFNLGSELYSAEYFVDICFRGPQIEYTGINSNFTLFAQASATDFVMAAVDNNVNPGDASRGGLNTNVTEDAKKYTALAGLKVKAIVVCDNQEQGNYKFAHNGTTEFNGRYDTIDNEANMTSVTEKGTGGDFRDDSYDNQVMNSTNTKVFWGQSGKSITTNQKNAPRFCKIRYVFTETNGLAGEIGKKFNLRKWQRHGAEMCTWTEISESAAN